MEPQVQESRFLAGASRESRITALCGVCLGFNVVAGLGLGGLRACDNVRPNSEALSVER